MNITHILCLVIIAYSPRLISQQESGFIKTDYHNTISYIETDNVITYTRFYVTSDTKSVSWDKKLQQYTAQSIKHSFLISLPEDPEKLKKRFYKFRDMFKKS